MATIVTRQGKGTPLTNAELDANFTNLNADKLEAGALSPYLLSATAAATYQTIAGMSSYLTTSSAASTYFPLAGGSVAGNLDLSGSSRRITGDFTSATRASRVMFQTSTANSNTFLSLIPSGTGTGSGLDVHQSGADPDNTAFGRFAVTAASVNVRSGISGTGTQLPLTFLIQNTEAARFSTSANFLIGSTTDDGANKLQVTGGAAISGSLTLSGGTANGVPYLNGSKVVTSGSALTFDGSRLMLGTTTQQGKLTVDAGNGPGIYLTSATGSSVVDDVKIVRTGGAGGSAVATNAWIQLSNATDGKSSGIQTYNGGTIFFGNSTGTWTEQMRLDGPGNLGLGVTPSAYGSTTTLTIGGKTYAEVDFKSGSTLIGYAACSASALEYTTAGAYPILFKPNSSEAARFDSSGNLGLGTTSPAQKFEVSGAASGFVGQRINNVSGANGAGVEMGLELYNSSNYQFRLSAFRDTNEVRLNLPVTGAMTFYTSNAERARITSSGNFGIGNTSPTTTLSIGSGAGSGGYGGGVYLNRGASVYNFYEASDGTNAIIIGLDNNLSNAKIGTVNSYPVGFYTGNSERMRLDTSGNMGLGTSSPFNNANRSTLTLAGAWGGELDIGVSGTKHATFGTDNYASGLSCRIWSQDGIALYGPTGRAMTLDSSGNLLVGRTDNPGSSRASFYGTGGTTIRVGDATNSAWRGYVMGASGSDSSEYGFLKLNATSGELQLYVGPSVYGGFQTFYTAGSERARITSSGYFGIATTSPSTFLDINPNSISYGYGGYVRIGRNSTAAGQAVMSVEQAGATSSEDFNLNAISTSYSSASTSGWGQMRILTNTTRSTAYNHMTMTPASGVNFYFRGDGNAYAHASFVSSGVDYAEYFESVDGSTLPVGATVVLVNGKVRLSTDQDAAADVLGIVRPKVMAKGTSIVGGAAPMEWTDKYLTDDYGQCIMEPYSTFEWDEEIVDEEGLAKTKHHDYVFDAVPENVTVPDTATVKTHHSDGEPLMRQKLNPAFDPDHVYVPREKRPEWHIIGLLGQIPMTAGQKTGGGWVKMKDISSTVELWFVK